ncbi:DOMON-like domain-containing protein [Sphingomonas aliaeris]|uniref:DOMON-like domain-containing protein n=1 Tax=Sphingomonas aliaeris TaxID=2759526 RepID=A0A974S5P2_9SPHN|nr:DOMON-like domain-containing protein [Sphingomonas aliaeris]
MVPHPDYPPVAARSVRVDVAVTADGWRLDYRVEGAGGVLLPERAAGERTDGLWKTTCFELFVRAEEGAGYSEFNFSPSGDWAAYCFDLYREGMRDLVLAGSPDVRGSSEGDCFRLEVALAADGLAPDAARIGLSAVIEEAGAKSFWALDHAAGAPDFHNRDCFTARLAAPEAS